MSQRPLDLSSLPPDVRRAVEKQLAKLPPQAREKLLREGSPIVEKMLARARNALPPPVPGQGAGQRTSASVQTAAQNVSAAAERASDVAERIARRVPKGHFNSTIRPGDSAGGGRFFVLLLVAAVIAAIWWP